MTRTERILTAADVIGNIRTGELDSVLSLIIQHARERQTEAARNQFKVGDTVRFDAKRRGMQEGTIVKIMPKNIKVRVLGSFGSSAVEWTVAPSLLEKVVVH